MKTETLVFTALKVVVPVGIVFGSLWSFKPSVRHEIRERYGYRCAQCGSTEHLQCHHIIPHTLGGRDCADNGVLLCGEGGRDCHEEWDRKALKQGIIYPGIPIQDAPHNLFKNENVRLKTLRRLGMK